MSVYQLDINDDSGDLIDLQYFCCDACASRAGISWNVHGPQSADGARVTDSPGECDYPTACETCGDWVGNPLTDEGERYARELMDDPQPYRPDVMRDAYPWIDFGARRLDKDNGKREA